MLATHEASAHKPLFDACTPHIPHPPFPIPPPSGPGQARAPPPAAADKRNRTPPATPPHVNGRRQVSQPHIGVCCLMSLMLSNLRVLLLTRANRLVRPSPVPVPIPLTRTLSRANSQSTQTPIPPLQDTDIQFGLAGGLNTLLVKCMTLSSSQLPLMLLFLRLSFSNKALTFSRYFQVLTGVATLADARAAAAGGQPHHVTASLGDIAALCGDD